MAVGIRHADHVAPSIRKKLAITSPTSGSRSVGIVHSRTQTMEFFLSFSSRNASSFPGMWLLSLIISQYLHLCRVGKT
jgi:hypothetical protein